MAKGDRPLGVEAPGVGAAGGQVMGDSFEGCKVCRALVKT